MKDELNNIWEKKSSGNGETIPAGGNEDYCIEPGWSMTPSELGRGIFLKEG